MRTILFIHHTSAIGGSGTSLTTIIRSLDKTRYRPIVICPEGEMARVLRKTEVEVLIPPRRLHQFVHYSGSSHSILSPFFLKHACLQIRDRRFWENHIRSLGADIVHLNVSPLAPMAISARRAGAKVVCHVRETMVHGWFGLRTAWLRHVLSTQADAVVFISEYERRRANCRAPIVETIPNWLDLRHFDRRQSQSEARLRLGLPPEMKIVMFFGGISRTKGTLPLLEAMSRLCDRKDWLLVIAGSDGEECLALLPKKMRVRRFVARRLGTDYYLRVRRRLDSCELADRVRFVGMHADPVSLFAAADVVVFPAAVPHQARPVFEAGAMAKPVIVSDFECFHEYVENGVNGLRAKANDAEAWAAAIARVLDDPALAAHLGEDNYRRTCQNHNVQINASRIHTIYDRILTLPPRMDP